MLSNNPIPPVENATVQDYEGFADRFNPYDDEHQLFDHNFDDDLDDFPPLQSNPIMAPAEPNVIVDTSYLDKLNTDSGAQFLRLLHNGFTRRPPIMNFSKRSLREFLTGAVDSKPLLIYVHSPEHPNATSIINKLLESKPASNLLNKHFILFGLIDSHPDVKILLNWVPSEEFPCMILMRKAGQKKIILDDVIALKGEESKLTSVYLIHEAHSYLVKLDPNFTISNPSEADPAKRKENTRSEMDRK